MVESTGQRIRDRRIELELTLEELGKKVGVGASTVRKWETGYIQNFRADKIQKVADALGVSPTYLIGLDDSRSAHIEKVHTNNGIVGQANSSCVINGNAMPLPLTKEETELLRIYHVLGVKARMKLLTTAMDLESEETSK
jgi:transcriptional regulator with XRE-family HTH domain